MSDRFDPNDVDVIINVINTDASELTHPVKSGGDTIFTWDYTKGRYPALEKLHLADYKVRILDGNSGTGAITRVLIDSRDERGEWSTVGASSNIIQASMDALLDSIEFGLGRAGG